MALSVDFILGYSLTLLTTLRSTPILYINAVLKANGMGQWLLGFLCPVFATWEVALAHAAKFYYLMFIYLEPKWIGGSA